MRRNAARGRLKVGGVVERFQEEQGVSGQLLLNKPWPVSIRLQELIRHETGRARVRDGGHWVTKRAESGQEGLRFYTASGSLNAAQKLKDIYWKTNKWRNQMIPSETNLPQFWRHPPTNTQPFHPDLLSPNRSTSLTTETDTLVSRSLVIYSVVVFVVGPLHWKEKKKHIGIISTSPFTQLQEPLHWQNSRSFPPIHRHLRCSLVPRRFRFLMNRQRGDDLYRSQRTTGIN